VLHVAVDVADDLVEVASVVVEVEAFVELVEVPEHGRH
jgi:hypothetical protein